MRQTRGTRKSAGEKIFNDIKLAKCQHYSPKEKITIVLDGLRREDSIAVISYAVNLTHVLGRTETD